MHSDITSILKVGSSLLIILCIDHSHIVLIIGDLNGLGHLPEFADQILVNGSTRSDRRNQYNLRMVYKMVYVGWFGVSSLW